MLTRNLDIAFLGYKKIIYLRFPFLLSSLNAYLSLPIFLEVLVSISKKLITFLILLKILTKKL